MSSEAISDDVPEKPHITAKLSTEIKTSVIKVRVEFQLKFILV